MFIELHMIQNFAPSCLNRDDTNTPKDCEFGGYRRARISSQCQKRAMRDYFKENKAFSDGEWAIRTKKLKKKLVAALEKDAPTPTLADQMAEIALEGCGLSVVDEKTQYLVFMGESEINNLARVVIGHWTELEEIAAERKSKTEEDKETDKKKAKKKAKKAVPDKVNKELAAIFQGGRTPEIALFGRMLADMPKGKVDGACQVAQAISTNQVEVEFDFYTAVDDMSRELEPGAGMMGTVEFNSACFYRYANLSLCRLKEHLGPERKELARRTAEAFLRAMIHAIPTGKQNSMAAHNPPSYILGVVRESGLWSLANAFVDPIRPGKNGGLIASSATTLEDYWVRLVRAYGRENLKDLALLRLDGSCSSEENEPFLNLAAYAKDSADDLVRHLVDVGFAGTCEGDRA